MIAYCVDVFVKEGKEELFLEAIQKNHTMTRQEPGNIRFDVSQSSEDPGLFFLYEIYENDDAVKAHKETEHYLTWRETVEPWMAKPRQGRKFTPHFPTMRTQW